jgi:hypothetical protein
MQYRQIRIEICKQCPSYLMGVCRKCGCFVKIKTSFKSAVCPIGKWKEENDS